MREMQHRKRSFPWTGWPEEEEGPAAVGAAVREGRAEDRVRLAADATDTTTEPFPCPTWL